MKKRFAKPRQRTDKLLQGLLERRYGKLKLSNIEFFQVLSLAETIAPKLGFEIIVIDFRDPDNLYMMDINRRHGIIRQLLNRRIIFFHTNVNYAIDPKIFPIARAHMETAARFRSGGNRFITSFDLEVVSEIENAMIYSPYYCAWGNITKSTDEIKYLDRKLNELLETMFNLDRAYGRGTINLVGEQGIGKTTLLWTLCDQLGIDYDTMIDWGLTLEDQMRGVLTKIPVPRIIVLDEADELKPQAHAQMSTNLGLQIYATHEPLDPRVFQYDFLGSCRLKTVHLQRR